MGASASSPSGSSGSSSSYFLNVSKYNPFGSSTPASGPTVGNAYNAQNAANAKVAKNAANAKVAKNAANAKAAAPALANTASASNAPANPTAGIKTNNAVQAVASSTGSPRIERVSSRMNGGKRRRNTRKGSRKNRR